MDAEFVHFMATIVGTALGVFLGGVALFYAFTEEVPPNDRR